MNKEAVELIKWELAILLETARQCRLAGRREEYDTERRIEVLRARIDVITGAAALDKKIEEVPK